MQLAKERSLNIFLIFTLLVSLMIPNVAMAYTVIGDADNPSLTIHKFEQEADAEEGEEGTGLPGQDAAGVPVEGVEFTLTQTHKYNVETDEWQEVTNVEPIIGVTGSNGQVTFTKAEGMELGRYTVEETDGPSHVILNTEVFSVDIPMTNKTGDELNYNVHIYPKNEIIRGDVVLTKQDENGEQLEGVVFGLYNANDELIDELSTNEDGQIIVQGLAQGKYYFKEHSTVDGFAINTNKINFEVVSGAQNTVDWTLEDGFVDENGVVTNYEVPVIKKDVEGTEHYDVDRVKEFNYNLTITTPGDINKYTALGVTDTLDPRLEYAGTWSVTGTGESNIEFTETALNGTVKLQWAVKDISQLTPNETIKITFTAKIKADAELETNETGIPNTAELEFDNNRGEFTDPENPPTTPPVIVTPEEGGLKITKVDKADHSILLEGAEFKLTTDEAGENIVDATGTVIKVNGENYTGYLENLVTNAQGEILIEGLTPGTYYLHETKAPTYIEDGIEKPYRLLTKAIKVEVENNVEFKEVIVENSKSGWNLPTTGGIGTILFTLVGLSLMGIALFLLLRRNKETQTE